MKYTPEGHQEYDNLCKALEKIDQVVDYVNERYWNFHRNFAENRTLRKRMAENEKKLAEIKGMLEGLEVIS